MTEKKTGGLYARVKLSVKGANVLVAVTASLLVLVTALLIRHGGFTVSFDTDGGSSVSPVTVLHSETVGTLSDPVKEGYVFTGWYADRDCTVPFDVETTGVEGSMTLYAGWEKAA